MKPRLRAEELTGMISLPRDKVVSWENLSRCCFVPMSRNSVFGWRSNSLEFIQESMSEKVLESISSEEVELAEWKKCTAGCHQHRGGIWLSSLRWQSQEELYKEWKEVGQGRNLEVHHKKDLRKMKWNFGWRLPEIRWKPVKRSTMKTKPMLKTMKKNGMCTGWKGVGPTPNPCIELSLVGVQRSANLTSSIPRLFQCTWPV